MVQNCFVFMELADILCQVVNALLHFHKYSASNLLAIKFYYRMMPQEAPPEIWRQGSSQPTTS
jgi:hypothetical protein